jgi:hypothetical protein
VKIIIYFLLVKEFLFAAQEKGSLVFLRSMNQHTIANLVSLERSASIATEEFFRDVYIKF